MVADRRRPVAESAPQLPGEDLAEEIAGLAAAVSDKRLKAGGKFIDVYKRQAQYRTGSDSAGNKDGRGDLQHMRWSHLYVNTKLPYDCLLYTSRCV